MEDKRLEYIVLYIIAGSVGVVIAALARLSALKLGLDNFTANVVFTIFIAIAFAVYLSIQLVLKNLMIPLIEKVLMRISYFREKKAVSHLPLELAEIRKENTIEKERKLKDAINYTRKLSHRMLQMKKSIAYATILVCILIIYI